MKKGNIYPCTRARWQQSKIPTGAKNCPCWIRPTEFYAAYQDGWSPDPGPRVVTQTALSDARWSYGPDEGWVIWRGTWDDGVFGGDYYVQQRMSWRFNSIFHVGINVVHLAIDHWLEYSSSPTVFNAHWNPFVPFGIDLTTRLGLGLPWFFILYATFRPMTYSEIEASGHNKQDTSPLTWDDPGGPG